MLAKLTKASIFFLIIITFFIVMLPFYLYLKLSPYKARKWINTILQYYCKALLLLIDIKLDHQKIERPYSNVLMISNHLSYLDIIILFSLYPTSFVTSIEMKHSLFLGQLVTLGGCLFVERRSRANLSREILDITQALKYGLNVGIFPEGTSYEGSSVHRFKRPLFQAAIDANIPILPITINYKKINGHPITPHNKDHVFWYGDMSFGHHLWNFFGQKSIEVSIIEAELILPTVDDDITTLSIKTHDVIAQHFKPI